MSGVGERPAPDGGTEGVSPRVAAAAIRDVIEPMEARRPDLAALGYARAMPSPLRAEHFDFFIGPADRRDPQERDAVLEALVSLWHAIIQRLPESESKLLGEIYAGPLEADDANAWVQTNRDDEHQDVVNLTLELSADDLQLNMVGGTAPQAAQLVKWLRTSGRVFWETHPDWSVVVFLRRARAPGFWMGAPWVEQARYPATEMLNKGVVSVRSKHSFGLDPDRERVAYHVRRAWARDAVLSSTEGVVPLVAAVQDVLPALRQARTTAV